MNKVLLLLALACACTFAQAIRVNPQSVMKTQSNVGPGGYPQLLAVPGASVAVCSFPANGAPCTNYATTYSDSTANTSCPTNAQLTIASSNTCVGTTDSRGNFGFWVNPGQYAFTVTYAGSTFGPYPFTAGASGDITFQSIHLTGNTFPNLSYFPVSYQSMTNVPNTVNPSPWEITSGTTASPTTTPASNILSQKVASVNTPGFASPSAITAYVIAGGSGGATCNTPGNCNNVIALTGAAQTNAGCGAGSCTGNAVGGIGVHGYGELTTDNAVTWGGWFVANDNGHSGGTSGIEINNEEGTEARTRGLHGGVHAVNIDLSGGTQAVNNDWGLISSGYGKGYVYRSSGNPGTDFQAIFLSNDSGAANNAATTVLGFESGQPGPFKVGLDFSNATFSDSAIKNASIKQPSILSGVSNGSGFEHFSVCASGCTVTATPCSTGATAGDTCTNTITMPVSMSDINFQAVCTAQGTPTGIPIVSVAGRPAANQLQVQLQAASNQAATYPQIDCIAVHN